MDTLKWTDWPQVNQNPSWLRARGVTDSHTSVRPQSEWEEIQAHGVSPLSPSRLGLRNTSTGGVGHKPDRFPPGLDPNLATGNPRFLSEDHAPPLASRLGASAQGSNDSPVQHEQGNKGRQVVGRRVGFLLKPDEDAHDQGSTHGVIHLEDREENGALGLSGPLIPALPNGGRASLLWRQ